jgi:hypothetical protein
MLTLLNIYVVLAVIIFAGGLITKVGRLFIHAVTNRKFSGVTKDFTGGPDKISYTEGLKAVLFDPITHFYRKANPSWNRGYMLYHIAIVTKATGYALAAVILFYNILMGNMVPDVAAHTEASLNYAPANLAALVFGSGEPLQAHYLFGGLGDAFMAITGVALIFAVVGNLHMVYTTLRNRGASAILHDIDQAAKDVRSNGFPKWDRVLVRVIIFTIIYTDIAARLHLVDGAVFFHAFLGASLLLIFPFTYLFHMIYNVLALFYSSRRRVARTIA